MEACAESNSCGIIVCVRCDAGGASLRETAELCSELNRVSGRAFASGSSTCKAVVTVVVLFLSSLAFSTRMLGPDRLDSAMSWGGGMGGGLRTAGFRVGGIGTGLCNRVSNLEMCPRTVVLDAPTAVEAFVETC